MDIEAKRATELQLSRRTAIMKLQTEIMQSGTDLGPDACPVTHHFAPGAYAREMSLPAGMVVVGKIHKHAHVNVISKGRVQVFTEHDGVLELSAPCTFVSQPGTKRVVHVIDDTVWTTVHVTDKTDLAEIEREVISVDFLEAQE